MGGVELVVIGVILALVIGAAVRGRARSNRRRLAGDASDGAVLGMAWWAGDGTRDPGMFDGFDAGGGDGGGGD